MVEDAAREKTHTLVSYSMAQAKLGEPITHLVVQQVSTTWFLRLRAGRYCVASDDPRR
jgi:hypothetical protein